MTILGKKQMSEEDIKLNYITPVILNGWKGHITMETKITDGRINISGNIVARSKSKFADYMLYLNDGKPISVIIEASFFLHLLDGRSITQNGRWITKKVDYREIYQKVPKRIDRWKLVRLLKKNHCCTQMRWNYGTNDFVLPDNQHSR